jgi:catechol 2,3-dioxygenase
LGTNLRVAELTAPPISRDTGLTIAYYARSSTVLAFGDYHDHVALNWFYSDAEKANPVHQSGLNHFAIVYEDESSLASAVARLLDYDVLIDEARDHGVTVSIYLRDPDGNGIELYYDRPQTQWFDSSGQMVIKSEPFDALTWLDEVWAGPAEFPTSILFAIPRRWRSDWNDDGLPTHDHFVVRARRKAFPERGDRFTPPQ